MHIHVKYFAAMRENTGKVEEHFMTSAKTVEELFWELEAKYHFSISKNNLKVAINQNYQTFDTELRDHDTVVFIPPVAGG